jgi:antitoxin VapB
MLAMPQTAKLFMNGRSQAVRLPAEFRFDAKEVFIRRDPLTGDVVLSRRPADWQGFLQQLDRTEVPADFLGINERQAAQSEQARDPLEGWGA